MDFLKQLNLFKKFYLSPHAVTVSEKQSDFTMHLEDINLEEYNQALQNSIFDSKVVQTIHYENKDFPIFQLD